MTLAVALVLCERSALNVPSYSPMKRSAAQARPGTSRAARARPMENRSRNRLITTLRLVAPGTNTLWAVDGTTRPTDARIGQRFIGTDPTTGQESVNGFTA